VRKALERAELQLSEIDLLELNGVIAAQAIARARERYGNDVANNGSL
jgi:acetyl-CoA acetyltransferase